MQRTFTLQFNQPNLTENVAAFLEESGLKPDRLELELTESAIMTDAESNIAKLQELMDLLDGKKKWDEA